VALDANFTGRPVYEHLGFQAVGDTLAMIAPGSLPAREREGPGAERVDDLDEIMPLDRCVFGGDRTALLRTIWEIESPAIHVIREADGPAGYLFARDRLLGPGCARTSAIAGCLVRAALGGRASHPDEEIRMLVPMECESTSSLAKLGFREERRLTHMRLGDLRLPGERNHLLAQVSFAAG
jgi:hypothetical protein